MIPCCLDVVEGYDTSGNLAQPFTRKSGNYRTRSLVSPTQLITKVSEPLLLANELSQSINNHYTYSYIAGGHPGLSATTPNLTTKTIDKVHYL